jgi:hypothetical protein
MARDVRLGSLLLALSAAGAGAGCGTLGSPPAPAENLPSSGAGPFRPLASDELPSLAAPPFVLDDPMAPYREPSVVAATDDGSSLTVVLFAVARVGGRDVIVRTSAPDARSFYGGVADNETGSHPRHAPAVVLTADRPWEGADLTGPSAVRVGAQLWLYYAGAGGIGLAVSDDGITFTKTGAAPVLALDARASWETTTPHAPSVAVMPDASWRMLYGAGRSIGEATSPDGTSWTRVDGDPSTPALDPVLSPGAAFDAGQVDDPLLLPRVTPAGRPQVRVLYTGYNAPPGAASRSSAVGFAARYGSSGPLSRQEMSVYGGSAHEAAPALFESAIGSILYVHQDETSLDPTSPYAAIGAAFAPASDVLPAAGAFPRSP